MAEETDNPVGDLLQGTGFTPDSAPSRSQQPEPAEDNPADFLLRDAGVDIGVRQRRREGERELGEWRGRVANSEENWQSWLGRHVNPFLPIKNSALLAKAQERMATGRHEPGDAELIATQERLHQLDAGASTGERIGAGIAGIPALVMQGALGGAALGAAGRAIGGATGAVLGGGAVGGAGANLLGRAAGVAVRGTLSAPFMPSLYGERVIQNNVEHGRDALDIEGLPTALGMAAVQNSVFGSLGQYAQGVGRGVGGFIGRQAIRAGAGVAEQQIADVITSGIGLDTGYGLLGDIWRGRGNDALQHLAVQAATFAAFGAIHEAQHGNEVLPAFNDALQTLSRSGLSPAAAARELVPAFDAINQTVHTRANLTPEQAREIADRLPEGPQRDVARALADTLPGKQKLRSQEDALGGTERPQKPSVRTPEPTPGAQEAPEGHAQPPMGPEYGNEPYLRPPGGPKPRSEHPSQQRPSDWAQTYNRTYQGLLQEGLARGLAPERAAEAARRQARGMADLSDENGQHWLHSGTQFSQDGHFRSVDGQDYRIVENEGKEVGDRQISVHDSQGQMVGSVIFSKKADGSFQAEGLQVHHAYQGAERQAEVARAMYDWFDAQHGRITPAQSQSGDAKRFWHQNAIRQGGAALQRRQGAGEVPVPVQAGRAEGATPAVGLPGQEARQEPAIVPQGTASVEDLRGIARSLGLESRGGQGALTSRIQKAGGQGLIDALTNPIIHATEKPSIDALAYAANAISPLDDAALRSVGSSVADVKNLQKEIAHEESQLSRRTGRSAASLRHEADGLLSKELANVAPDVAGARGEGTALPGEASRAAEVHRGPAEAGGAAHAPAATERGEAGGNELGQFFGVKPEQRTLIQAAEEGKKGFVGDMPRPKAEPLYVPNAPKAPKAASLLSIIKKAGGISKESARKHGWDVDAMEEHLPTVFENAERRKGKLDPTAAAEHLINEGHMVGDKTDPMLHDRLAEALTEHAVTLERDLDRENQRDQVLWLKENQDAVRDAAKSGLNPLEAQKALQAGIENGARQGIQDFADKIGSEPPESVHEDYARPGEAHEPPGAQPGDFNPADFGKPVSGSERAVLPGGGQPNAEGRGAPRRVTALANAQVDAERQRNGLPPLMAQARLANTEVWDRAMNRLDADPQAGANLVEELAKKPRATTVEENALLLHRKIALANEHERAMLRVIADGKPGANVDVITMNANEAREEELGRQVDQLDRVARATGTEWGRAGQFRRQLAAEDFSLSGMLMRAEAAKGRPLTPEEKAGIAAQSQRIAELQKKLDAAEAALKQAGQGIKSPEFAEMQKAQVDAGEARAEFERAIAGDREARQPLGKKVEDLLIKTRRAFVISSPKTMLKIIAATAERVAIAPMEELAGRAWAAVPGISKIAAMAPREGRGLNATAEKTALAEGLSRGMTDAWSNVRKGHSELDTLYGDTSTPRSWLDWVGNLHAAGKAPAVRAEYTRSFLQRIDHETAQGHDVTSPAALSRIGIAAYKDSNAAKFQQDNRVVDAWNGAIAKLRSKDSSFGARSLGVAMRLAVPVVRIPTNIVAEAFQYSFGTVTGGVRAAAALRRGVENLKPEQADLIMQSLKKGSIGMAAMTLGFLNPSIFGGFYSGRRDDRDVQAGGIKTPLGTIPFWLLHNPLLEVLQMGATVRRALDSTRRGEHPDFATAAASGILGISEELPMAREATDIGRKMFNLSPKVRGQYFGELAKSLAVPQLLQWLAGRADTNPQGEVVKRQPVGVLQHIQTGIPGLRNLVPQGR